ncbi:TetR/AcrR family transcriptional regulator [Clostridium pasteurianum]|uniref:Transcriptional regulator n=1 Tax=Clostridium pasteurianum BC1 TaxID=86416 RepID=R4KAL4_CLOPA|nr:TetR/AcrR family transcriptional regulator [Clostridium pasteurianum]AGK97534.1 transcriptional regulator [Clostridium pasteurianum BC1]
MCTNFEKLPEEKKKKIIDACIKEFSKNGYVNASTNNIVLNAGISKGSLFNYFDSKKKLYLYILDYAINFYVNLMLKKMKINNPDILKRILEWAELKLSIAMEQPIAYQFFATAFINIPEELKADIEIRYNKLYAEGYKLTVEDIDYTLFRDDIDKQKAIELIIMSMNGILEKYISLYKSLEDNGYNQIPQAYDQLKEYILILRKVYYKNS